MLTRNVFNRRTLITVVFLAAAVAFGIGLAIGPSPSASDSPPESAPPSSAAGESSPVRAAFQPPGNAREEEAESSPVSGYFLRAFEGKIGVFSGQNEEPDYVLDVYLQYLPEYDQTQLAQGVYAESYDQLMTLVEDYSS